MRAVATDDALGLPPEREIETIVCMRESSGKRGCDGGEALERAIVLLLSGDRRQAWSMAQLGAELGADPQTLGRALDGLAQAGVVLLAGAEARASPAARRIDELGLIGI
jgi:hypothetical protein